MKTKIGKRFFRLINKHFPPEHKFHKIFNRNILKLSYSCMPNLNSLINNHNQNILKDQTQSTPKSCNCLKKENCPMDGYVLQKVCGGTTLQSPATNKIIPSYIKELVKQLLKDAMQTIKSLLMFQPTKTVPNFLPKIGPFKQSRLTQKYHGKSKGDTCLQSHFQKM